MRIFPDLHHHSVICYTFRGTVFMDGNCHLRICTVETAAVCGVRIFQKIWTILNTVLWYRARSDRTQCRFTLHVDTSKRLYVNVSTDSRRLKVTADVLPNPANAKQSIARMEISDILEDNCYDVLYDSHCVRWANDTSNMTATECDMCSVINHDALKKGNCTKTRRRTVVKYWCVCDVDQDCGGPPPF